MNFWNEVWNQLQGMLVPVAVFTFLVPIPYIIAEQLRPALSRPRFSGYLLNMVIAILALVLSMPIGMAAGMAADQLHQAIGWQPLGIPFDAIGAVPTLGPLLKAAALMIAPLLLHDLWFYWSHRLEHRAPVLWAFHSLHHSDTNMNCTSWARDHFLQSGWRSFFSVFTLGMLVDLDMKNAGAAAMLSTMALMAWSMFYHSAIRVELPWLDRVLVTPQVHRIHHSVEPAHHNRNFADIFPIMDILFGTYEAPRRGAFQATGLNDPVLTPQNPIGAHAVPVLRALRLK